MAGWDWTPERDKRLRELRAQGWRNPEIADELRVALSSVWKRVKQLGLAQHDRGGVKTAFFTPDRDEKLRALWTQDPPLPIESIRAAFDHAVSRSAISARAVNVLKLPPRYRAQRASRAGQDCKPASEAPPKPRVVVAPAFTPCPYFDPYAAPNPETGKIERCGEMVDRRVRKDGSKPPQYCEKHLGRVTPLPSGCMAGARMLNPGASFGGVVG